MIPIPRKWDAELECSMSDYGHMYKGYYLVKDKVLFVGLVVIDEKYRGVGRFGSLLENFKLDMNAVVLYSPTFIARRIAERHDYIYSNNYNIMFWERD